MGTEFHIGVPHIERRDGMAYLTAPVDLAGRADTLWFRVDEEYAGYLTDDRADAFVVALMTGAMKAGADIVCEAPLSRRLLYQLRHYLIPMLAANLEGFHHISLRAEPSDVRLPCEKAVATGWTGGADSMYTLMRTLDAAEPGYKLTHLMIADNGAIEGTGHEAAHRAMIEKAERTVGRELGLPVVGIGSNIQELFPEPFLAVAAWRQAAVILALQKLFGVYYSSAAYEFSRFAFDVNNCFYYELVLFDNFQTDATIFYSAYGAVSRAQKLKELSDYPLAWKYLHPCVYAVPEKNCGRCGKCVRTMTALYGLGTLDRFSAVFDVEAFERDKDWYIANTLAHKESQHYGEALMLMRERGLEPSERVVRMARIMRAAGQIADERGGYLAEKLGL